MKRRATLRMLRLAGLAAARREAGDWVGWADVRTSLDDARAALSLAAGAPVDEIDPSNGTWAAVSPQPTVASVEVAA